MLTIPRKQGESIVIGEDIVLTVVAILGDKLRLRIDCPSHVSVQRGEVHDAIGRPAGQGGHEPGHSFFFVH